MHYRSLGRTGLLVSEICLGTMTYGGKGRWQPIGQLGLNEVEAQVRSAFDAGVNFIDTANVYSEGDSESLLGQALKKTGIPRDELVIASKVRIRMGPGPNQVGLSRGHMLDAVDASLKRLQLDHIDLYQIHGQDLLTPMEETLRGLEDLVRSGRVRYIGVSNHAAWQIMKALGISERRGWGRFESVQAYWSLASRELEREIVPMAVDQGLGILVWSPLAGGLLSGKFTGDGKGP
jgi:aryl-alcohol dehydrogenase-like predicted oxidoreductase